MFQRNGEAGGEGFAGAQLPAPRDELLSLADVTLAAYLRYLAAYGGVIHEEDGLLLFAGAHRQPNPYRNGALRLTSALDAGEVLARARRFFAARKSSYALWVREHADADLEHAAERAGFRELEQLPELVLSELPEPLPTSDGVELRQATDSRTREDYLGLVAGAWGMAAMPHDTAARVFFEPASLADPNVVAFVAYYDDQPISAAMTYVSHSVALGCQGATLRRPAPGQRLPAPRPQTETRGLAASCLCAALDVSFKELGAAMSLGQTSSLGAPVWLSLGYQPFTSYRRYLVPMHSPGQER
jgi:hypothetical protein